MVCGYKRRFGGGQWRAARSRELDFKGPGDEGKVARGYEKGFGVVMG